MHFNRNLNENINYNEKEREHDDCIRVTRLARAYFPIQHLDTVYDAKTALERGTLFPELDFPYNPNERR